MTSAEAAASIAAKNEEISVASFFKLLRSLYYSIFSIIIIIMVRCTFARRVSAYIDMSVRTFHTKWQKNHLDRLIDRSIR
jgi:hypothetical protein